MDPSARQGVEVGGQNLHQGLAFAGLHLGDPALVQNDAADDLDRVGPHVQHTAGGLPAGGEGLGQQILQSLAIFVPGLQLRGLGLQRLLVQSLIVLLQGQNPVHQRLYFFYFPLGAGSE